MQGVYTYIPETNHVPREHCVAAIQMLLFMVRRSLVIIIIIAITLLKPEGTRHVGTPELRWLYSVEEDL